MLGYADKFKLQTWFKVTGLRGGRGHVKVPVLGVRQNKLNIVLRKKTYSNPGLTLFDMGFFELSVLGGGMMGPHYNFVVVTSMIMKFGIGVKLDVFYTTVAKKFVTSLLLRNYDVITCILADMWA